MTEIQIEKQSAGQIKDGLEEQFSAKLRKIHDREIKERNGRVMQYCEKQLIISYGDLAENWFLIPKKQLFGFSDTDHKILIQRIAKRAWWWAVTAWIILLPIPIFGWMILSGPTIQAGNGATAFCWYYYRLKKLCGKSYFLNAQSVQRFLKY